MILKWDRFADGIIEDIVTDLSHSKDLFVVARNSTEVYKDKPADVRSVGRDLGVHYVLEGSIQPLGDQIRRLPSSSMQELAATFGRTVMIAPPQTYSKYRATSQRKLQPPSPATRAQLPRPSVHSLGGSRPVI